MKRFFCPECKRVIRARVVPDSIDANVYYEEPDASLRTRLCHAHLNPQTKRRVLQHRVKVRKTRKALAPIH